MKPNPLLLAAAFAGGLLSETRAQVIAITNGVYLQNFDNMGSAGTNTPAGWLVSWASSSPPPVTLVAPTRQVTAGDGAVAPSGTVAGWNFGNTADSERALGTAPTSTGAPAGGGARALIAQFRNTSGAPISSFSLYYDGEQWRTGSSATTTNRYAVHFSPDGTNYVDLGPAWGFLQPTLNPINTRLDGNQTSNRVAGLGGRYTPALPVAVNQTFFLRWYDDNEAGTDPALAIDNVFLFQGDTLFQITSPVNGQTNVAGLPLNVAAAASPNIDQVTFLLDDLAVVVDSTAPYGFSTNGIPPGTHAIRATGRLNRGGTVDAGPVSFTVVSNQPPVLVITNSFSPPFGIAVSGTSFLVGSSISIQARASDELGLQSVSWFVDGEPYVVRTNASYNFTYADARFGTHTVHGIATDQLGLTTTTPALVLVITNPPAYIRQLITNGSVWQYHTGSAAPTKDDGGLEWYEPGYNADDWLDGEAELGFGDAADGYPERTVIDGGPATNRFRTVYFRHTFRLDDTNYIALTMHVLRDDGAVIYVNGQPIWTNNITAFPVTHDTLAVNAGDDGLIYTVTNLPSNLLIIGDNVVAAEVHQSSVTSVDLGFDLMLWGRISVPPPMLQITNDGINVTISWTGARFTLLQSERVENPTALWIPVPGNPQNVYRLPLPPEFPTLFFRLRSD